MGDDGSWRTMLDHDGIVVIELTLIPTAEGGLERELTSGYKADWTWPDLGSLGDRRSGEHSTPDEAPRAVRAPIDIADGDRRCIRPGETGLVHAHPYQPELWAALPLGATVNLCRLIRSAPWTRVVGHGVIVDTRDLPDHPVPLRSVNRPVRPGQAVLRAIFPRTRP